MTEFVLIELNDMIIEDKSGIAYIKWDKGSYYIKHNVTSKDTALTGMVCADMQDVLDDNVKSFELTDKRCIVEFHRMLKHEQLEDLICVCKDYEWTFKYQVEARY